MDIHEKIESRYYYADDRPSRPKEPAIFRKCAADLTAEESRSLPRLKREHEQATKEYKEARDAYLRRQVELENEFKRDLEEEHGVTGHPKAERLFQIAWDHGHSAGFSEVLGWYSELAELIQE